MADTTNTNRLPPQNIEAEQALLGAILSNNRAMEKVSDFLHPEHFVSPVHGKIYDACRTYISQGRIADPITLKALFTNDEDLKDVGGSAYLMKLAAASTTIINASDYAHQILDRYIRRRLIDVGTDMVNDAFDIKINDEAIKQIETAEKELYEIANEGETTGGPKLLNSALQESLKMAEDAMKNPTGLSGLTTGLVDLDRMLDGLHDSDLIILGGRPAMGKSALAITIAYNAACFYAKENQKPGVTPKSVAFFSLEMSAEQVATRILSSRAEVGSKNIRSGKISNDQFDNLAAAVSLLSKIPLYIDETPGLTVQTIKNRARRLKRDKTKGLGLIVVDYLQLITAMNKSENRVEVVSEITRQLKILAKELNVPVLVLSQLSRAGQQRETKQPQLTDLRESGSIEQDADIVMFVHREIYYLEAAKPEQKPTETPEKFQLRMADWEAKKNEVRNQADVIIAKYRHGPVGTIKLYFSGEYCRFSDLQQEG